MTGHSLLFGQEILNNGFEDWNDVVYFEEPAGYSTTNMFAFFTGTAPNATKTTDAVTGDYALRLETILTEEGELAGAAFIGEIDGQSIKGGIPYNVRPDSLTGYAHFDIKSGDTGYVAAIFKKFGLPIGYAYAQFIGIQEAYTYFSIPTEWLFPIISPDTVAIGIISSTIFAPPVEGSILYVDNVQFVGDGAPFPNGDFENWSEFSSEEPDHWQSTNIVTMPATDISVFKSTDSHSGNFAARIVTQVTLWQDTVAFITNGGLGENGPTGGMAVENIPDKLTGYYKFMPNGPDTALAAISMYHYNNVSGQSELLDQIFLKLPATDTYTFFELAVDYNTLPEPDTVNIAFGSGNFDAPGAFVGIGSELLVDDIGITFKPDITYVEDHPGTKSIDVYPNPVRETLHFKGSGQDDGESRIVVLNSSGQTVKDLKCNLEDQFTLDVRQWQPGLYFYEITSGNSFKAGKFIVN